MCSSDLFVPVSTVVDYHLKFLEKPISGTFNIGTGRATSFEDVARMIADRYSAKITHCKMPEILKDSYQKYTCANMSKTIAALS